MEEWGKYYASQSIVTDPGRYKNLYDSLPNDIPALCAITQGLILHLFWGPAYNMNIPDDRKDEVKIRKTSRQLERILELADLPLATGRTVDKRIIGTCRDYATLLTSFLRRQGIPARIRAGFVPYLKPDRYENHYLCQYWNASQNRWITVDAQLDDVQLKALNILFDPHDLPEDQLWLAGQAWQVCRQGKFDPELFGIQDSRGLWFVGGILIHDMLALNKIESQPWDIWPLMPGYKQKDYPPDYLNILDRIATLSGSMFPNFNEVRSFYQTMKELQPLSDWKP